MDAEIPDQNADPDAGEKGQIILEQLFEQLRAGLYIGEIGGRTGAANPHLKRILGFPLDTPDTEVRPFDIDRFADPKEHAAFLTQLARDGHVDDYSLRLRREDGTLIWLEVSASSAMIPHQPDPPHPTDLTRQTIALVRDISERRRGADETRDLHHQLQQAEKMAALGQTISGVAHELNNPLATILSWAERLAEGAADDKTRRGVDVIRSESERAARIVRNLLTFARKRQTTRMMVDVNDLIRETLALRGYEQRIDNIRVTQALGSNLPRVFADGYQIKQVLLNLVINAEQALQTRTPVPLRSQEESGELQGDRAEAARDSEPRRRGTITFRTWEDDGVVVEVADDGPGISEERQARIFDPFYTTKEVGQGTGLGLSVAYGIVQEHGGRIWVMSQPGRGASFFVKLPLPITERTAAAPPAAAAAEDTTLFKGKRVLVVEDEVALATAVVEALGDAGFVVDRAADGEEALTSVAQNRYDLLVCDLRMPKLDGMQFYRAMAAAAPALARRVIFVTGAVTGTDAERFLEETACRWLPKPFRLADLLRAARETLL